MCGLAGFRARGRDDVAAARVLASALAHRGPDGSWSVERDGWMLVETRLAVVDLSSDVRYPMPNETDDVHLLFNGEIYDHVILRRQLEGLGHRFRTACDAEVVVHGYEEWGVDVFRRLDGMFAVALVDGRRGELVLARDRFGIKPLVRSVSGPHAFGSDAIALVAAGLHPGAVDEDAVRAYAAFHYVPPPAVGIAGLEHVDPGTAVVIDRDDAVRVAAFVQPVFGGGRSTEPPPTDEEAADALVAAVRRQLVADVPVGVLLSGGLDSAAVLAAATAVGAAPRAFTLTFTGFGGYDEAAAARRLARRLGAEHREATLELGFVDALASVADAFDSPFGDASAVATIEVARLARRDVTVVLTGTGGDDLFAGYYRHRAHRLLPALRRVPPAVLDLVAAGGGEPGAARRHRLGLAGSYAARLAAAPATNAVEQYLSLVGSLTSAAGLRCVRLPVDLRVVRAAVARRRGLGAAVGGDVLDAIQRFELQTYLPGDLLTKEDRATMAVGLEGRVPLLDAGLADIASRATTAQRAGLRDGKRLLRRAAARLLGDDLPRGKRGFAVPLAALLAGSWRSDALDWLQAVDSSLVDGPALAASFERGDAGAVDVWALASLAAWERRVAVASPA